MITIGIANAIIIRAVLIHGTATAGIAGVAGTVAITTMVITADGVMDMGTLAYVTTPRSNTGPKPYMSGYTNRTYNNNNVNYGNGKNTGSNAGSSFGNLLKSVFGGSSNSNSTSDSYSRPTRTFDNSTNSSNSSSSSSSSNSSSGRTSTGTSTSTGRGGGGN